jgi:hypothetical protein
MGMSGQNQPDVRAAVTCWHQPYFKIGSFIFLQSYEPLHLPTINPYWCRKSLLLYKLEL